MQENRPKTAREMGIMAGFPPPAEKRPTLENWDLAPFNRWSFRNMRSLFPTVDVHRGPGAPWVLPEAAQDLGQVQFRRFDGTRSTIAGWLRDSYTDGLIVLARGTVAIEHYENGLEGRIPHLSQSVAKSLVGTLAGILHHEGLVDLAAPLATLVPELIDCGYGDCTLDQALDMQSGVRFTEDYGVAWSDMTRIDVASGWRPIRPGEIRPTIRDVILSLPKVRGHGELFEYRSIETDVVAWALERTAGADLATLLSSRIWSRLGMEENGFFTVDGAGTALADGGFNATLRDYARFGLMMAQNGHANGQQIVPEGWIDGIRRGGERGKFGPPYDLASPNGAYRRFWWVQDVDAETFMARGVFGQMIWVDPRNEVVIVKLSSWPDYLIPAFTHDAIAACAALTDALTCG